MGKFDAYKIDLKGMKEHSYSCEYELDNHFFDVIDAPEVRKGKVHVSLTIKKTGGIYELTFKTDGVVQITCDRCLDDMDQPISSTDVLRVKLGPDYSDEGDMVVIPEDEGIINVAWFMYEFIALSIPMKHVHAPGKCNKAMVGKLNQYMRTKEGDEEEGWSGNSDEISTDEPESSAPQDVDPRWNELKKIIDNN